MDRIIQFLLTSLKDPDISVREAASEALEMCDIRSRLGMLRDKVGSGEKVDRIKAIYTLGRIRGNDVFDILSCAMGDPVEDVRAAAVRVVSRYHDMYDRFKGDLRSLLDDPSDVVRREVLEALGNMGGSDCVEDIIRALHDRDSGVVEKAAEALGKIGDSGALDPLIECAERCGHGIKTVAIRSIGNLKV